MKETIAIAADHAGYQLKKSLAEYLENSGYEVLDLGTNSEDSVDYPDYAYLLAEKVANREALFGVIICGSGLGVTIAANRNKKIRATLCQDEEFAKLAREHNNANVIAFGARFINQALAKKCLRIFLTTKFAGGRHQGRVDKL